MGRGVHWSDAAPSQGMPGALGVKEDSPLQPLGEHGPADAFRESISIVLSQEVCGHLLQQPYGTTVHLDSWHQLPLCS